MESTQRRIASLERRVRLFYVLFVLMAVGMTSLLFSNASTAVEKSSESTGVLRARGLVIVDEGGRERILIGAPIPQAKNRVRTDLDRVKRIWGPGFPTEYMEWYKNFRHDLDGMLVLDEDGFDRLAIGDRLLDANAGRRYSSNMTGLVVNQEKGQERGGYGVLKVNEKNRMILTMDSLTGQEGVSLSLHDGGGLGFNVKDGNKSIFLGSAPPKVWQTEMAEPFQGLLMKEGKEVKHNLNVQAKVRPRRK